MVGIIHPFSVATRELPHLPLHELVWIAWNRHRGEREHNVICVVCANVGEWCLDLIWSKWEPKKFIKYNEFIHLLIFTNTFKFDVLRKLGWCSSSNIVESSPGYLEFSWLNLRKSEDSPIEKCFCQICLDRFSETDN